ncbi:acyl-CoA oxidase [Rhizophagus irregularis DAOM 181602=DAOM 197198]|nr:acyl-CoA oxidase [Rhizophagus irregularis DAOM 181602=DAOM 197198]
MGTHLLESQRLSDRKERKIKELTKNFDNQAGFNIYYLRIICYGRTANHAIVMEKLKSSGKDYDLRPFIVQIRDLETQLRDIATSEYINLPNNKLSYGAMRPYEDNLLIMINQKIERLTYSRNFSA